MRFWRKVLEEQKTARCRWLGLPILNFKYYSFTDDASASMSEILEEGSRRTENCEMLLGLAWLGLPILNFKY